MNAWQAFRFMYGFVPRRLLFWLGICLYTSQVVTFPLINSALMGGLAAAITGGGYHALWLGVGGALAILAAANLLTSAIGVPLYVYTTGKTEGRALTCLFRAVIRQSAERRGHSGAALSALNTDARQALDLVSNRLAMAMFQLLALVVFGAALFAVSRQVGLYTAAVGLLSLYAQTRFAKPLGKLAEGSLAGLAEAVKLIGDLFAGGAVIRAFGLGGKTAAAFGAHNDRVYALGKREADLGAAQNLVSSLSALLTTGGLFAVGGLLIADGRLTLVTLMAILPMSAAMANALTQVGQALAGFAAPTAAANRLRAALGGDVRLEPLEDIRCEPSAKYDIRVDNLTFTHLGADKPALDGVTLYIPENAFAAFVGESGSGKSTLLKAVAGLYERDSLPVALGGEPFDKAAAGKWRASFAYVDQLCTLFNMTIAENIALGKPGATLDEIKAAAREAGADGFIDELGGYDVNVGEGGAALSGGQRGRVAIARALLRRSPVLIFDEAASALDAESEAEVAAAIGRLRGTRTILMATHNLPAIAPDMVFRADGGAITAETA